MARPEAIRHLTGAARFTDDLWFGDAAFGYVLRSPHAHARLRNIDTVRALEMDGVHAAYTGSDLVAAGLGLIPCFDVVEQIDGSPMVTPPHGGRSRSSGCGMWAMPWHSSSRTRGKLPTQPPNGSR